jgi:hypothetical protein
MYVRNIIRLFFLLLFFIKIIAIALMMEVVSTSETSVNLYQITRRSISEDSHFHTYRCENLKSHRVSDCSLNCIIGFSHGQTQLLLRRIVQCKCFVERFVIVFLSCLCRWSIIMVQANWGDKSIPRPHHSPPAWGKYLTSTSLFILYARLHEKS